MTDTNKETTKAKLWSEYVNELEKALDDALSGSDAWCELKGPAEIPEEDLKKLERLVLLLLRIREKQKNEVPDGFRVLDEAEVLKRGYF